MHTIPEHIAQLRTLIRERNLTDMYRTIDALSREEIGSAYADIVGYDCFADDPAMSTDAGKCLLNGAIESAILEAMPTHGPKLRTSERDQAIADADIVIETTAADVAKHVKGMAALIAAAQIRAHGFYACMLGSEYVCFVAPE